MNSNKKNYYEVLGVTRSCSQAEIRKVYHKLARKYHPDVTLMEKSYAEYMMASVSEAYKILSDPETRAAYDKELDGLAAEPPSPQQPPYTQRQGGYGDGDAYGGRSAYNRNSYSGSGSYGGSDSYSGAYGSSYGNSAGNYYGSQRYYQEQSYAETHRMPEDFAGKITYVLGFLGATAVNIVRHDPLIRKVLTAFAAVFMLNLFVTFLFFMSGNGKSSSDYQADSAKGIRSVSQNAGFSSSVGQTVKNSVENYKDNVEGFTSGYTDTDFYKFSGMEPYMSYTAYCNLFPEIKLSPIDRVHNVSRFSCRPAFGPPFKGFPPPSNTIVGFDSSNRLCMVSYYFSPDEFTQVKNYYYAALGPFLKHKDAYFFKRGDFVVMLDPYSAETNKASLTFCVDIRNILKEN